MQASLHMSKEYRGQLLFSSSDPYFRYGCGRPEMLTDDLHIINQDQAVELCNIVAQSYELMVEPDACKRLLELVDETEPYSPSFISPFGGFQWRQFQKRAINVMRHEKSVMLQMGCGLGKSYTSLMMALQRFDDGEAKKIVVFCPVALIYDWVENFKRASKLTVDTPPINKDAASRAEWYASNEADVWIMNYERIRTVDRDAIKKALRKSNPVIIYDEITKVKNRKSALHKEMCKLRTAVNPSLQVGLTATPIVTGPEDFYNEFRLLSPATFGNVSNFERLFTYGGGEKDFWGNYIGYENLGLMHVMAGAQVFSATKARPEIAAEFPKKQEVLIEYELSPKMRQLYDEIYQYGKTVPHDIRCGVLFALTFMRICNMPSVLLADREYDEDDYGRQQRRIDLICRKYEGAIKEDKNNAKMMLAAQKVDEIVGSGEKCIVFAQHTHNCLFPLARYLDSYKPLVYSGETSLQDKERIKHEFKETDRNLLLMSDAGQVGLNFQECRYLIHYQTPVSHAAYEQRSDRISRLDSDYDSITVIRFVAKDTIEERVEDTMQGRMQLASAMGLGGDEYEEYGTISIADADYFCGF